MSKLLILFIVIFGTTSCITFQTQQANECGMQYSWSKLPITLYLDNSITQTQRDLIIEAMDAWEAQTKLTLFNRQLDYKIDTKQGRDMHSIIYFKVNEYPEIGEQANTNVMFIGNTIVETDIRVNGINYIYAYDDYNVASDEVHFKSLMVHELGHVLGLLHYSNTVMNSYLPYGTIRTTISKELIDILRCQYGK